MPFACVPNESKNKIKKAGDILITSNPSERIYKNAYDLATQWRAAHKPVCVVVFYNTAD